MMRTLLTGRSFNPFPGLLRLLTLGDFPLLRTALARLSGRSSLLFHSSGKRAWLSQITGHPVRPLSTGHREIMGEFPTSQFGIEDVVKTTSGLFFKIRMSHKNLRQFPAQSGQSPQGMQNPITIHGREGFIQEKELRCSRHSSDIGLCESQTETEGQTLKGSTGQLVALQEITFGTGEEFDLKITGHLSIPISATCQMRE